VRWAVLCNLAVSQPTFQRLSSGKKKKSVAKIPRNIPLVKDSIYNISPGKEKAPGTPYCSLSILKGGL